MQEAGESSVNLEAFAGKLLEAVSQRDALRAELRSKELRIAADEALVARVNALPPLRQVQAWCADFTEDLSGEVATAEVPGEIGNVIIKPGFEGNAWSATEDGIMQPTLASTPAATFYNLAMLPGWQKWRPTFRIATITSLQDDTCSISLDATTSSQQGLGVNARASYSNVPILYMDCNGSAFEVGDQVLVAFAGNVEGPTVVGFEQAPKACDGMVYITTSTEQWDKPAVNYALAEYYEHSWLDPDVFGLPVASGSYQIHKQLVRDNLEASVAITHDDSWAFTHSITTRESGLVVERRTNTWSISHECHVSGKIKHFGRDVPIQYLATLNKNFSVSRDGYEPTDPSFWSPEDSLSRVCGWMMEVNPSEPFLDMHEAFTLGAML
ncbi:hypothetical protein HORIV_35430 [Vreelandella olivaria]|uniref:Uncharacterized protein n=1 Tax=Vreelandella olivaria TaxID=390919 RepID=A0ABN5X2P8_9GAMM|nr:hypothetical protein HORIV_35430 [Halomonas olivaria]